MTTAKALHFQIEGDACVLNINGHRYSFAGNGDHTACAIASGAIANAMAEADIVYRKLMAEALEEQAATLLQTNGLLDDLDAYCMERSVGTAIRFIITCPGDGMEEDISWEASTLFTDAGVEAKAPTFPGALSLFLRKLQCEDDAEDDEPNAEDEV